MNKFSRVVAVAAVGGIVLGTVGLSGCQEADERTVYTMDLTYSATEQTLSGEMTVSVFNGTDEPYSTLAFSLAPNAYRDGAKNPAVSAVFKPSAYYRGESYGNITLSTCEGATLSVGGEDESILTAQLSEPIYPDERGEITLNFHTKLATVNHRLGVSESAVNLHGFYPLLCVRGERDWQGYTYSYMGDPFYSECADYTVNLTLPSGYGCAFGGEGEVVQKHSSTEYEITLKNARDCALVVGEDMRTKTATVEGVEVCYSAFGEEPSAEGLQAAVDSLSYYSRTFGRYPYSRYTVAQTGFCMGGMESSGLSLVSNALRVDEIAYVVAHETAHQWWYSLVGSDQLDEAWQDEGLAEYSTALFFNEYETYGVSGEQLLESAERAYKAYFSLSAQLKGEANTVMSRPLSSFESEYEYENIAYRKGALLFRALREYVGDGAFFSGLKSYAKNYAYKLATPAQLADCFGGKRAEELIASFTQGKCVI